MTENRHEFVSNEVQTLNKSQENVEQINVDEIKEALSSMKNGKAAGPGNVPVELIKAAPNTLLELLAGVFNKCLDGDQVPSEWKTAYISPIYKKGNRQQCQNYRVISLISTLARLYGKILKKRMEREFRDSEEQNG